MSELADRLFAELGAEMGRQFTQGRNELASALYTGQAFVLYGEGQQTPQVAANENVGVSEPTVSNEPSRPPINPADLFGPERSTSYAAEAVFERSAEMSVGLVAEQERGGREM